MDLKETSFSHLTWYYLVLISPCQLNITKLIHVVTTYTWVRAPEVLGSLLVLANSVDRFSVSWVCSEKLAWECHGNWLVFQSYWWLKQDPVWGADQQVSRCEGRQMRPLGRRALGLEWWRWNLSIFCCVWTLLCGTHWERWHRAGILYWCKAFLSSFVPSGRSCRSAVSGLLGSLLEIQSSGGSHPRPLGYNLH